MARTRQTVKTTRKTTTRSNDNGGGRMLLFVAAIIVLLVVYRQLVLGAYVRGQVPEAKLQTALQACVQDHVSLSQLSSLQSLKAKESMGMSSSISSLQGIFKDILNGMSAGMVQAQVKTQYVTEIKVLGLEDFFGQNAQMRISGAIDIQYQVPVIGILEDNQQYQLQLNKRGEQFNFIRVSVKKPDQSNWSEWECTQQF